MRSRTLVDRFCTYSKAIGEPNRMKMIKILGSAEPETHNVSSIAEILHLSQPAATRHLKVLEAAGFVMRRRKGANVYYSLDEEAFQEYYELTFNAFKHSHTPCVNDYDCETCPYAETCTG